MCGQLLLQGLRRSEVMMCDRRLKRLEPKATCFYKISGNESMSQNKQHICFTNTFNIAETQRTMANGSLPIRDMEYAFCFLSCVGCFICPLFCFACSCSWEKLSVKYGKITKSPEIKNRTRMQQQTSTLKGKKGSNYSDALVLQHLPKANSCSYSFDQQRTI